MVGTSSRRRYSRSLLIPSTRPPPFGLRGPLQDDQGQVVLLWGGAAEVEDVAHHGFEDRVGGMAGVSQQALLEPLATELLTALAPGFRDPVRIQSHDLARLAERGVVLAVGHVRVDAEDWAVP